MASVVAIVADWAAGPPRRLPYRKLNPSGCPCRRLGAFAQLERGFRLQVMDQAAASLDAFPKTHLIAAADGLTVRISHGQAGCPRRLQYYRKSPWPHG